MTGEMLIAKRPLMWGAAAALPASAIAWAARGADGAVSTLLACAIVLANAGVAAVLSAAAGKVSTMWSAMISMPSFAFRMAAILGVLGMLKDKPFIDEPTFAATFGIAVTGILVMEALRWKRTPWLALTLEGKRT